MRRTLVAVALVALLSLAVVPVADAHRLGKKRAADATVDTEAKDCADHPELYPGCTDTTATDCRRLTRHKVKCTGHIVGTCPSDGIVACPDGVQYDCERVYTWKIKPRRRASLLFGKRGAQTCQYGARGAARRVAPADRLRMTDSW
jgi:hypothetical protein